MAAGVLLMCAGATGAPGQAPPAPRSAPQATAEKFVVVLDAAHGGSEGGARLSGGQMEKSVTLALSVRLRSLLQARGFQVVTTRENDATVDLNRRAEMANHAAAAACISFHASESGNGVHLYVSSLPPAAQSRFAAWKTAQAAWVTQSLAMAGTINGALLQAGLSVVLGRTALPAVDSMTCPAVAVELAPQRAAGKPAVEMTDGNYQRQVAEALAAALMNWRAEAHQP